MRDKLQKKTLREADRRFVAAYEAASCLMQCLRSRQSDPLDSELEKHWTEFHGQWEEGMDWISALKSD